MPSIDPITAVHQAVEARLRTAFTASQWAFELVPSPLTLDEFKAIVAKATPWLGFAWRELAPDPHAGRRMNARLGFTLTLVVKNQGRAARFLGDRLTPGLYAATLIAAALLHGHTVAERGTLFVTRAGSAFADGWSDLAIAIATVEVEMVVHLDSLLDDLAENEEFLRLVSAWDVGAADAGPADTIEVEGP